jgi:hypothetical protein
LQLGAVPRQLCPPIETVWLFVTMDGSIDLFHPTVEALCVNR